MLAERLIAAGYRIPQSLLSRLVFAAVLYWQHDPHWIDDGLGGAGNILVYNNGNHRRMDGTYYMHQPGAGFGSAYSDLLELELPLQKDGTYDWAEQSTVFTSIRKIMTD